MLNLGIIHLAFGVDSKEDVDANAREPTGAGFEILRRPRTTRNGYFE